MDPTSPIATALRLTGRDPLPVLHRISTQVLEGLAPGEARATLFCDFRGRLLHRAIVAVAPDGAVWLLRGDADGAPLAAFVDRHVFREDVVIEDRSSTQGPGLVVEDGAPGAAFDSDGPVRVATGDGSALLRGAPRISEADRIARGIAAHGAEITEAFNPFEVGLGADVHLAKGCFTGQETLQRLVTYESVRRGLVRGEVTGGADPSGQALSAGDARVGVVTSATEAPIGHLLLAVVKLDVLDVGAPLALPDGRAVHVTTRFEMPRALGRP